MGWAPAINPKVAAEDANDKGEIIYTATWQKNTYTVIWKHVDEDQASGVLVANNLPWAELHKVSNVTVSSEPTWETVKQNSNLNDPKSYTLNNVKYTWTDKWREEWDTEKTIKTYWAVYQPENQSNAPDKPTEQEVNSEVKKNSYKVAVVVYCKPGRHELGKFDCYNDDDGKSDVNIHPGRIKIGEVKGNAASGYTCDVTFLAEKYCAAYNKLKNTTGNKAHTLVDGEGDKTVTFKWNASEKKWELDNTTQPR